MSVPPQLSGVLADEIGPHVRALRDALQSAKIADEDAPTVQLALHYAGLADQCAAADGGAAIMIKLGPPYLAALTALGMSPSSRAAILRGSRVDPPPPARSARDDLKARRAARADGTRSG